MYAANIKNPADSNGRVLFSEVMTANNGTHSPVVNVTLTGQQIKDILEQQWSLKNGIISLTNPLDVSYNVHYIYSAGQPVGQRIEASDVLINGEPLDLQRSYRVAVTSAMASTVTYNYNPVRIASWVVLDYFKNHNVIQQPVLGRVTSK
jgi:5'-nucleotidase